MGRASVPLVFVLAAAVRVGLVLTSRGGPTGDFGYDAGVYYTAADALLHGRMPYADFLLLHPPLQMLVLTPFAALGTLLGDRTGFLLANTAYQLLGAVNAALVVVVARRLGLGRRAALTGGVFYALWLAAALPEVSARLEPLGTFAFLLALVALTGARRHDLLAGIALGCAMSTKIWWAAVLVVVVAVLLYRRSRPWRLVGGAVLTAAVIDGPFFARAPAAMFRMVVSDQLGRQFVGSPEGRLGDLTTINDIAGRLPTAVAWPAIAVVIAAFAVVARRAWRQPAARPVLLIAAAQLLLLGSAPSFFGFYTGFPAAAIALTVAAGAAPLADRDRPVAAPAVTVFAVAGCLAAFLGTHLSVASPFPGTRLAAGVHHVRCLMADAPIALIDTDRLTPDFEHGCANWVDVTGRTYGPDRDGSLPRLRNPRWQRSIRRYLLSGDAVILVRPQTGLDRATRRAVTSGQVLVRAGGFTVHRTG